MNMYGLLLAKKLSGGGGGSSTLVEKTITANGTYNPADDNADGYSSVTANVPNTYTAADEGKVVDNGALVSQTSHQITSNNTYNTTLNNEVVVNVPNTYDLADEGKVVDNGALVSQTAKSIDANGLYDTTLNNSVNVEVPNSYTVADEGKVVSSGALVSQTAYPSTVTQNGTYDTTLNNSVTVDVPPVGVVTEKDVNFYDYDGTLLYSYTAQEFLTLSDLPATPVHTGNNVSWNWTLSDAQTFVTTYSCVDIGAIVYQTNTIQLVLDIPHDNFEIYLYTGSLRSGTSASIDWGDGATSSEVVANTNNPHTYTDKGVYTLTLTNAYLHDININPKCCVCVNDGTNLSYVSSLQPYIDCIIEARGYNILNSGYKFAHCRRLKSVSTTNAIYMNSTVNSCESLSFFTVASGWTSCDFENCYALTHLSIPKTTDLLRCQNDYNLKRVILTHGTTIYSNAFYNCYSLNKIIIPTTITEIQSSAFYNCYSLSSIVIPNSVTTIASNAFYNCTGLNTITIDKPEGSISGAPWGATNATVVWTG